MGASLPDASSEEGIHRAGGIEAYVSNVLLEQEQLEELSLSLMVVMLAMAMG